MLELKTKTFKVPISIDPEARESFRDPLIFYLAHKDDKRAFFLTFVILDFLRQELLYIASYYLENISLIEQLENSEIFGLRNMFVNPHCSIRQGNKKTFLTFFEKARYFTQVDFEKNIMRVYTGEDIGIEKTEEVLDFGATFYRDENDPDYFYLTALTQSEKYPGRKLHFYKTKLDLSKIEEIYVMETGLVYAPHATRQLGKYLLNSDFLSCQIKNNFSGRIFSSSNEYALFVYGELYREYCLSKGKPFSVGLFRGEESVKKVMLNPGFHFFCQAKGKNFLAICQDEKYAFTPEQGTIMLLDLEAKKMAYFKTTYCCPAHFEVDDVSGDIFVSSHNFLDFLGQVYFLGPAAIDRFSLNSAGQLKKIATFTHPLIYRMTSHKIFSYEGRKYICSFGQPNRLVFVDVEKMEMIHYQDIEEDITTDPVELLDFINDNSKLITIKTIEVSRDGKFIFFLSHKFIYIYNFPERKIVQKIKYLSDISFGEGCNLHQFYMRTTHVDYFV